jgi:hypothetical protein
MLYGWGGCDGDAWCVFPGISGDRVGRAMGNGWVSFGCIWYLGGWDAKGMVVKGVGLPDAPGVGPLSPQLSQGGRE